MNNVHAQIKFKTEESNDSMWSIYYLIMLWTKIPQQLLKFEDKFSFKGGILM